MSIDSHFTKQPERPSYPQPTPAKTTATALAAVLVSSLTLGGVLSLFEMRADETACGPVLARRSAARRRIDLAQGKSVGRRCGQIGRAHV